MKVYYSHSALTLHDIYLTQYGEQQCTPSYHFGPAVRNNFIIHYVYSGKGELNSNNNTYSIHAGQFFIIYPEQSAYYRADENEPWLYRWIEFNGALARKLMESAGFSRDNAVLYDNDSYVGDAIKKIIDAHGTSSENLISLLWNAIAAMTQGSIHEKNRTHTEIYLKNADNYIHANLHKKLTVQQIADFLGISRNHLSRIYTKEKGISIQQYIISLRLHTAAQYLKNKDLSIKEIAHSVGYSDPLEFSKAFKKQFNVAPSQWRNEEFWLQSVKVCPN